MYIQTEELELVNNIKCQKPYGKSWISFFNFQTKEIQIFDPINLHIVQYIKIGQNITNYQFSYDKSFVILKLDQNCIMIQDLINDVKSIYNNVDEWYIYNNEVWIQQNQQLLTIKDNTIISSKKEQISDYKFGIKFLVKKSSDCHKFINIGKIRLRYFLKEKNIYLKNFSSNMNFWGVMVLKRDQYLQTSLRFLNRLYKQIKLIRKIRFIFKTMESKSIKIDVISLIYDNENGIHQYKIINATNGRVKKFKSGFNIQQFVLTNDLKTLIYQEEQKYKICQYSL